MLTDNLRDRWRHFRRRRNDVTGADRPDLWYTNTLRLLRMKEVTREEVAAPPGAPAPTRFLGVSWVGIGPQPLRIDAEQNFQGSGPDSGEVVDILIDPSGTTDQTILIATNNGGIWKSVDGGATWQTHTDFMPSLSMGALAMDPVDHQTVYAGTGNNFDGGAQQLRGAGIYRSIDGGDTWLQLAAAQFLGREIVRMVIPAPNVLIVATNNGLFRSIDGGVSFGANAPTFNDGNALVAGHITDLALDKASVATVYASVRGTGILVSTDGGITFPTNLFSNAGAPSAPFDWISFAQSTHPDNTVLYALVTDSTATPPFKGLFRSSDRGSTWNSMPGAATAAAANKGLQNAYDVTIGVDPRDPNRVYIGFQELSRSVDGGATFTAPAITANFVHWDHHAIVFTPHGPATAPTPFYVGTDGGIALNSDGNTAWTNLNETISTNLFLGIDIGRGNAANNAFTYGGCQDTGTSQRRPGDSGKDWHEGVNGDGSVVCVDPNNPQRAYARDNSNLIITSDGGGTWVFPLAAPLNLPAIPGGTGADARAMGVDPNSSAVVYVANATQLFRSSDTAATFVSMHTFPDRVTALATTKLDSKILVVGCANGSLHRTVNADTGAASTWTALTVNGFPGALDVTGIAIDPTDVKSVAITYGGLTAVASPNRSKHVFFSADVTTTALEDISGTDGGSPDSNVPDLPVHGVVFDHSTTPHGIIIGCDIAVLRTIDNGATWHIFGAAIPNADCTSLAADYTTSPPLIRLGTYGRGVFELSRLTGAQLFVYSNLAFPDTAVSSSSDVNFDLVNVGDAVLTINDVADASSNPHFALVSPPATPFTINPGDIRTLTLRYSPTLPGKQITAYTVTSNDASHPSFGLPVSGFAPFSGAQVTSVLPSSGPAAGGTPVTIMGSGFTGATAANFGATAATGLTVNSDTQISAVTPAGTGIVAVTIATTTGTTPVTPASHFTYTGAGVVVTGLNPSEGPETGGTTVTISGSGFTGATQVLFGAFAASGITVDNDSQIHAISPTGSGTVHVLVATPTGTSPAGPADQFRFTNPGGGTTTGTGTGTTGTGTSTGTGAGTGEEEILHALADILRSGSDPEILEAQRILLRRIALEGNIIDSRVPAPKNITEVGGYVNLLTTLGHTDIRTQMLASVLGVAGPATPVGLSGEGPVIAFIPLPNDRPTGPAQPSFSTSFTARTDMADALTGALQRVHGFGCALPLYTPPRVLPFATPGQLLQIDFLQILGRVLQVPPGALLADPANDSVAIARLASDPPDHWQLVVREIDGAARVTAASWVAYEASDSNAGPTSAALRQYVPLAPILADAGWYSSGPFALPTSITNLGSLPRLLNVTGLVKNKTTLGDELLLLYPRTTVMSSALAGMLPWVWNGTTFVPNA